MQFAAMVPAGLTLSGMLSDGGSFVTAYQDLLTIVVGLLVGVFGVWFIVDLVRAAFRR